MSPHDQARELYRQPGVVRTFEEDYCFYLEVGIVLDEPELFVMTRPVVKAAREEEIKANWVFDIEECDCWHFHVYAGNLRAIMKWSSWALPWVSFERKNGLIFLPTERITSHLHAAAKDI